MLPIFLMVAEGFPQYEFVIAGAPGIDPKWYGTFIKNKEVKIVRNQTHDLLMYANAALVSSGTATLETALFNVPQVVCYRSSFFSYQIAKRLVKLQYISLVNLVLNREVVKELIQDSFTVDKTSKQLEYILSDAGQKQLKADYQDLRTVLGKGGASEKTAELIHKAII